MSYNIDSIETPVCNAWMAARDIIRLEKAHRLELPESNFLSSLVERAQVALVDGGEAAKRVTIDRFTWCNEGSGRSLNILKNKIAPHIRGSIDAIFTWEGGDSFSGWQIRNGLVYECDVVMTLRRKD
jgi:hypothetical protein